MMTEDKECLLVGPAPIILGEIFFSDSILNLSGWSKYFAEISFITEAEVREYINRMQQEGWVQVESNTERVLLTEEGKRISDRLFGWARKYFDKPRH